MTTQVFAFARIEDDAARKLVNEEIYKGRSRFCMWEQRKSLKEEYFGRNRLLLEIRKGDWIVHINMPEYGKWLQCRRRGNINLIPALFVLGIQISKMLFRTTPARL